VNQRRRRALGRGADRALDHWVAAASTIRTFSCGSSLHLGPRGRRDAVSGELLSRAWRMGAGPGAQPLIIDIDSTICETNGLQEQGGSKFTYTKGRGLPPAASHGRRAGRRPPLPAARGPRRHGPGSRRASSPRPSGGCGRRAPVGAD
jgi:hypothetical protein